MDKQHVTRKKSFEVLYPLRVTGYASDLSSLVHANCAVFHRKPLYLVGRLQNI